MKNRHFTPILALTAMIFCHTNVIFAQIKVTNNGRVAMGTNTIDTIYKVAVDGTRYCALSLTTNHLQDYGWNMISHVNRCLTKCYIVDLDSTGHTFWVNGCGQIYSQGGAIYDGVVHFNQEVHVHNHNIEVENGDVNVHNGGVHADNKVTSNTGMKSPTIFQRIGRWLRSDTNYKYDFQTLNDPLALVQQLNGYSFRYIHEAGDSLVQDTSLNGRYLGFKAQELATLIPEVVCREYGDSGDYGVEYETLTALLVEAMKQQQGLITALQSDVSTLQTENSTLNTTLNNLTTAVNTLQNRLDICCPPEQANPQGKTNGDNSALQMNTAKATLYQNNPNPFNENTVIGFNLPMNCGPAMIVISDLTGKQVKRIDIKDATSKEVVITAGTIVAGTYNYSLVCSGKWIDTKKMMIIE